MKRDRPDPSRRAVLLGGVAAPLVGLLPAPSPARTVVIEASGLSAAVAREALPPRLWERLALVVARPSLPAGGLEPTLGSLLDTVVDDLARHPVLVLPSGLLWQGASASALRANLAVLEREIAELIARLHHAGVLADSTLALATEP